MKIASRPAPGGFVARCAIPLALCGIIAIGAALRMDKFTLKELETEEASDCMLSQGSPRDAILGAASIVHPPLGYVFMNLFGTASTRIYPGMHLEMFRIPSIVFGILAIITLFFLGRSLFGNAQGLGAAFVLALLPGHIVWSRSCRLYSLHILLCLLSFLYFHRMTRSPRAGNFILYVVTTSAALMTHYFTVAAVAAQWGYLLFLVAGERSGAPGRAASCDGGAKRILRRFGMANLLVAASFLPWAPFFLAQIAHGTTDYGMRFTLRHMGQYARFVTGLAWFHRASPLHYAAIALAAAGFAHAFPRSRKGSAFVLSWLVVPGAVTACAVIVTSCTTPRNIVFVLPAYALCISHGIFGFSSLIEPLYGGWVDGRIATGILFCAFSAYLFPLAWTAYPHDARHEADWRALAAYVEKNLRPGDTVEVIFSANWLLFYVYWNEKPRAVPYPAVPVYRGGNYFVNLDGEWEIDSAQMVKRFLEPGNVWVVQYGLGYEPDVDEWLERNAPTVKGFGGRLVLRYKKGAGSAGINMPADRI